MLHKIGMQQRLARLFWKCPLRTFATQKRNASRRRRSEKSEKFLESRKTWETRKSGEHRKSNSKKGSPFMFTIRRDNEAPVTLLQEEPVIPDLRLSEVFEMKKDNVRDFKPFAEYRLRMEASVMNTQNQKSNSSNFDDQLREILQSKGKQNQSAMNIQYEKISDHIVKSKPRPGLKDLRSSRVLRDFFTEYVISAREDQDIGLITQFFAMTRGEAIVFAYEEHFSALVDLFLTKPTWTNFTELLAALKSLMPYFSQARLERGNQDPKKIKAQAGELLKVFHEPLVKMTVRQKLQLVDFMASTGSFDDFLLDNLLWFVNANVEKLSVTDIVDLLLANAKNRKLIPYELLYKLRNMISPKLERLRPKELICVASLYTRARFLCMEHFYEQIFTQFKESLGTKRFTLGDVTMLLYAYSRQRFRDESMLEMMLQHLKANVTKLSEGNLRQMLIALAELNYSDYQLYSELEKKINLVKIIKDLGKEESINRAQQVYFSMLCNVLLEASQQKTGDQTTNGQPNTSSTTTNKLVILTSN